MPVPPHSAHDYPALLHRWEKAAQRAGLELEVFSEADGHPITAIRNQGALDRQSGGLYVSAGVHGDECAPVWGLLEWFESQPEALSRIPVTLFPCLNPIGLLRNTRLDGSGNDLNRSFSDTGIAVISEWQRLLGDSRFELSLNLHEDYDTRGIYLYELTRRNSCGDSLLAACEEILPRETATEIDGSSFHRGLLVRTGGIEELVAGQLGGGYPEAILLFLKHCDTSLTFETPSEAGLDRRIDAHRSFLEEAAHLAMLRAEDRVARESS